VLFEATLKRRGDRSKQLAILVSLHLWRCEEEEEGGRETGVRGLVEKRKGGVGSFSILFCRFVGAGGKKRLVCVD